MKSCSSPPGGCLCVALVALFPTLFFSNEKNGTKKSHVKRQIPKLHVVDLCCGSGLTSFTLTLATKTVERITAVDRRPEQVMPHFKEVLLDFCLFFWGEGRQKGKVVERMDDFWQIVEFFFDYVVFVWLSSGMEQCSNIEGICPSKKLIFLAGDMRLGEWRVLNNSWNGQNALCLISSQTH